MLKFGLIVAGLAFLMGLVSSTIPLVEETLMKSSEATLEKDVEIAVPDTQVVLESQPLVRVGIMERYDRIDFRIQGNFSITDLNGTTIFSNIKSDRRWRCKVETSSPARFIFSILMGTFNIERNAERLAEKLRKEGYPARILPFGRNIIIGGMMVHKANRWRVIVGAYDDEQQALPFLEKLSAGNESQPRILKHRIEEPQGTIELYDSEYDRSAMLENGFRIVPESSETEVTLYDVRVGIGYHWEHIEDRIYRHVIELRIDSNSELLALNELLIDDYLKGVVPSEMHPSYPIEALKAQAVAARSYTIFKLADTPTNDPIDFPATVAFQVYSGITNEDPKTNKAVAETAGEVLKTGKKVCETFFSSNSGGHTESKEFWSAPGESYLVGKPVMPAKEAKNFNLDLTLETDAGKWIRSHPDNYSNPRGTDIEILDKNVRYFRWEVTYSRQELESIIKRKLGFDIGTLIELQPLRRGKSGRIVELEILGSHRNHKVFGELNIRRALSASTLNSSCFIVESVMDGQGNPVEITLIGAGFGHGVGMDQTAAGVMATKGLDYKKILHLFYDKASIEKIW
ncbi:MAG: SpoIID/LytB domain-containing protein [Candidatus Electryonea clarkiae]|nr:SpoIID/LytB domain-containing protein [Candidatus Electryonea clarkiae]MDP8286684.1 SpoIID/LytB domain-containing protein [Candidatus Electryonea clarkiae]